jgi:hypothetical protein
MTGGAGSRGAFKEQILAALRSPAATFTSFSPTPDTL